MKKRIKRPLSLLLALVLVFSMFIPVTIVSNAESVFGTSSMYTIDIAGVTKKNTLAKQLLDKINARRQTEGLSALKMDSTLFSQSMKRAAELPISFSTISLSNENYNNRGTLEGKGGYNYGECILASDKSADQIVSELFSDNTSNIVVTSNLATEIGIGAVTVEGNDETFICIRVTNEQTLTNNYLSVSDSAYESDTTGSMTTKSYGGNLNYETPYPNGIIMYVGDEMDLFVTVNEKYGLGYKADLIPSSITSSSARKLKKTDPNHIKAISLVDTSVTISFAEDSNSPANFGISVSVVADPSSCGHTNAQHVAAAAPSLDSEGNTVNGNTEYWYCDDCKCYFSNEGCTDQISQAQTVIPYFEYTVEYNDAMLTKCNGRDAEVTVPETVPEDYPVSRLQGCKVTRIGENAFSDCAGALTTVNLGERIEEIKANAFNGCSDLTTLNCGFSQGSYTGDALAGTSPYLTVYAIHSSNAKYMATGAGKKFIGTDEHTCVQNPVVWNWTLTDGIPTAATASIKCDFCDYNHVMNAAVAEADPTPATCTEAGHRNFVATLQGSSFTDTYEVETDPEKGHRFDTEPEWTWAYDYSSATATFTCSDCTVTETVTDNTIDQNVTLQPTKTTTGKCNYTASVEFEGHSYSKTVEGILPVVPDRTAFINESGEETSMETHALTGSETALEAGWYTVSENVTFTNDLSVSGNVNIIIEDDRVLTFSDNCNIIKGDTTPKVTFYAQSGGSGKAVLSDVTCTELNICGGEISAVKFDLKTLNTYAGKVTVSGKLTATDVTLGWRNASDSFTFASIEIHSGGIFKIRGNLEVTNNKDIFTGTISDRIDDIAGTTLYPINTRFANDAAFEYDKTVFDYDGTPKTVNVTVTLDGNKLTEGVDYTVEGNTQTNVGKYTLTVEGSGIYSGTLIKEWRINKTFTVSYKPDPDNPAITTRAPEKSFFDLTAPVIEGKKFAYWAETGNNENIVSYYQDYRFVVMKNVDIEAVYVDDTEEIIPEPVLTLDASAADNNGKNAVRFIFTHTVTGSYDIQEVGLRYSNNFLVADKTLENYQTINMIETDENFEEVLKTGSENTIKNHKAGYTSCNGTLNFLYTVSTYTDLYVYMVGYVVYTDGEETYTVYSDVIATTYNQLAS